MPLSRLSVIGGVHIGARALLDIYLIWIGYTARLSQWGKGGGGGGYFTRSNDFYLPLLRLEEEGEGGFLTQWLYPTGWNTVYIGVLQRFISGKTKLQHLLLVNPSPLSDSRFLVRRK